MVHFPILLLGNLAELEPANRPARPVNRRPIIEVEMSGYPPPAQVATGPASLFHNEKLLNSFIEYDPYAIGSFRDMHYIVADQSIFARGE